MLGVSVMTTLNAHTLPATDFRDPGAVLSALNEAFRTEDHGGKFFTIWYGVYQASTRRLRYSGGGHPAALLLDPERQAGRPTLLESAGPMPGFMTDFTYSSAEADVEPGSRLMVYSDGIYELQRPDGSVAGFDDFVSHMAEAADKPVMEHAIRRAERMCEGRGFDDDVSLVVFHFP